MDNSSLVPVPEQKEPILLICPPGLIAPQGFPLKIRNTDHELNITQLLGNILDTIAEGEPCVIEVPGSAISVVTSIARMADIEIRAILGFEGEYPSQWRASAATLPTAIVSEIMAAAGASTAIGGDGIPDKKKAKDEMKPADTGGIERRLAALKSADSLSKVDGTKAQVDAHDNAELASEG